MKQPATVLFGLCLLLAACSGGAPPGADAAEGSAFSRVVSLPVGRQASRAELEAEHRGRVIAWHPEHGVAILGLRDGLSTLSNANADAFRTPEVGTLSAFNNGYRTWGGGHRAWGGGYKAWGGGAAGGPTTFSENVGLWDQVWLVHGQNVAPNLGRGVKVAVIDTGIGLAHPAFAGRLAPAAEWRDFVDDDAVPQEVAGGRGYGHGTAVAGVVLQIAPNATILPLRVLDEGGTGDLDDVIMAVDWAVRRGAKLINLSLGTNTDLEAFRAILEVARKSGVTVVASAGNNGTLGVEYPARYREQVVGVGSVAYNGVQSVFSSYGDELDLMAPGEFVYSAFPGAQAAYASGTSFAAPAVTGAFALALGQRALGPAALEHAYRATSRLQGVNPRGTLQIDTFLRTALAPR